MADMRLLSSAEQVAAHLKQEIWKYSNNGEMMGTAALARQLGVNHKAVHDALHQLEREGILSNSGPRRKRRLVPGVSPHSPSLRIALLLGERDDTQVDYILEIQHQLSTAGHHVVHVSRTLNELRMDVRRVQHLVGRTRADAWVILAGSRGVLEWFAEQPFPTFALFGRRNGLPIAGIGPDKVSSLRQATRRLIELGHRRISMISRRARRIPTPGAAERAFLNELESHGIGTSGYNLPDWEDNLAGLHERLKLMFQYTPPTALIVDEAPVYLAVHQYLLSRGIHCPEKISMICTDGDPYFEWLHPSIAHIAWDSTPCVRRINNWASRISRGGEDIRQSLTKTRFVEGGTIGPPA